MQGLPPRVDVGFVRAGPAAAPWVPHVLDAGELARWSALRPAGRPLFLAAHVGVRVVASMQVAWAGSEPQAAPDLSAYGWVSRTSGKPSLTFRDGSPQPLHISVAHAGSMALVAVAPHGPIGVDIEHIDARRPLLALARRFFSPEEAAMLEDCAADERRALFHQLWTRKEAVLKTTGAGLRGGMAVRVDSVPARDGWRRVELHGHGAPLFVRDLPSPDPALVAAIAIEGEPGELRIGRMSLTEQAGPDAAACVHALDGHD